MDSSRYLFYVKTSVHADNLKKMFTALKHHMSDINLIFTEDGIKIRSLDSATRRIILIDLESDKFDEYICNQPVEINLNLNRLIGHFKQANNKDIVILSMLNPNYLEMTGVEDNLLTQLNITFIVTSRKGIVIERSINTNDVDNEGDVQLSLEYPLVITMKSSNLHFMADCLKSGTHSIVHLLYSRGRLEMTATDDRKETTQCILQATVDQSGEPDQEFKIDVNTQPNEIISLYFQLGKFYDFTRYESSSSLVKVYINGNEGQSAIMLEYMVGNLGPIRFGLPCFTQPPKADEI